MRAKMASSAALLCFVLWASSASATTILYDNGPINGTIQAFPLFSDELAIGQSLADSFTLTSASTLTGVSVGLWVDEPTAVPDTVTWVLAAGAPPGTLPYLTPATLASLTNTFDFTNSDGFLIFTSTFSLPSISLPAGEYTLNLTAASATQPGAQVYWDVNNGPSSAWSSAFGSLGNNAAAGCAGVTCSETFQITGTLGTTASVPEPATLTLTALGLAGVIRRYRGRRTE